MPYWRSWIATGNRVLRVPRMSSVQVWEILKDGGVDPAPDRAATSWAAFLRGQAEAILACDFVETVTLLAQRQYVLAVIEHATRRVRVLGLRRTLRLRGSPRPPGTWSWTWRTPALRSDT